MRQVKGEVYGSRNSILAKAFQENNISFIHNIWFLTCRSSINKNVNTRYLVLLENDDAIDFNIFKSFIPVHRLKILNKEILVTDLRTGDLAVFHTKTELKNWIIEKTDCKYVEGSASGSRKASWLSRFYREVMGRGFAITDIDFFITKHSVFVEEKDFVNDGLGFLGDGQYRSFLEIKNDFCKDIDLKIVLNQKEDFYVVDINSIDPNRKNNRTRWGAMIEFDLGRKHSIKEIIRMFK